jgi:hypothetical protein
MLLLYCQLCRSTLLSALSHNHDFTLILKPPYLGLHATSLLAAFPHSPSPSPSPSAMSLVHAAAPRRRWRILWRRGIHVVRLLRSRRRRSASASIRSRWSNGCAAIGIRRRIRARNGRIRIASSASSAGSVGGGRGRRSARRVRGILSAWVQAIRVSGY